MYDEKLLDMVVWFPEPFRSAVGGRARVAGWRWIPASGEGVEELI